MGLIVPVGVSVAVQNGIQADVTVRVRVVVKEGVVVKPEQPYIKGVAPFLKVRSSRYLSIIYGYDYMYPSKYEKLVRQKRTDRKRQTSIDEYAYGKRMLEIPRSEISMENKEYTSLFARLIFEEKQEEKL